MRVLVAGAGYVGAVVASRLAEAHHQVTGWVAHEDSAKLLSKKGVTPFVGDVSRDSDWKRLGESWDAMVYAVSTSGGQPEAYRNVHEIGLNHALQLGKSIPFIYTSSTSVYHQTTGEWVTEDSPTQPTAEGSQILLEAEAQVLQSQGVVLRLAGIYGPERSVYLKKIREGSATLPSGGQRWVNQIHRDDAAHAILWALHSGQAGSVFNVCDDEPVLLADLYIWLAEKLKVNPPPTTDEEPTRKRGLTSKRVSNAKISALGWRPHFRTFREGYLPLL
jgi:nucleoside-diphosphate-sugar epimerase